MDSDFGTAISLRKIPLPVKKMWERESPSNEEQKTTYDHKNDFLIYLFLFFFRLCGFGDGWRWLISERERNLFPVSFLREREGERERQSALWVGGFPTPVWIIIPSLSQKSQKYDMIRV